MKRVLKYSLVFLCAGAVFLLGMNAKKTIVSTKKKWKKDQPVAAFPVLENKPFVVIIPSYNNVKWVERNLRSVLEQKYDNFRVLYIDDASLDGTYEAVSELIGKSPQGFRVKIWRNEQNCGAMENIFWAVSSCSPEEIVVMLDGDDWLSHENVLQRLNEVYADPDAWMTCGNYLEYPSYSYTIGKYSGDIPNEVLQGGSIREYSKTQFSLSHLKTFYAFLFHQINQKDLMFDGKFFDSSSDQAMMIPIAELAGVHYRHIKDVLYIYNRSNPLNDDKVRSQRQQQCTAEIRSRSPYTALKHLAFRDRQDDKLAKNEVTCLKEQH